MSRMRAAGGLEERGVDALPVFEGGRPRRIVSRAEIVAAVLGAVWGGDRDGDRFRRGLA